MNSRPDAPQAPPPPDRSATAPDEALFTSEELFGELVDAPPASAPTSGGTRGAPIRVQVAERKSREAAEPAGASHEAAAAAPLEAEEMAALLDAFDEPPSGPSAAPSGVPLKAVVDADQTPPAGVQAAPPSEVADVFGTPMTAPAEPLATKPAQATPEPIDLGTDALAVPGPARPRGPAWPPPVARRAGRLPFDDASAFESLLDALDPVEAAPALVSAAAFVPPSLPEAVPHDLPSDGEVLLDLDDESTDPQTAAGRSPRFVAQAPHEEDRERDEIDLLGLAESSFEAGAEPQAEPAPKPAPAAERPVYGPYHLLERIATGGMAELFRAKRTGVSGFEKIVAVKRILAHLSQNKEFVDMFVDEAKLVAGLTHPNIVQIFDLGRIGRSYFIAMEYVHGRDLRTIHKRAKERGVRLPLDLSVLVVSRVCAALEFAHRKKDERGQPLQIVHRDVSPQNVLISFEGDVKLTDFGIAKAQSKASITDRGSLRGKLLYMSPEQASGKSIDRRSDLFALGIVLYELVTGERPFGADSERSILEAIRECRVRPPRALNPRIPDRIEAMVMKALERDPDDRYQDAAEMLRDLERVLRERQAPAAPELAKLMAVLFDDHERDEVPPSAPGESSAASGDHDVEFDHPAAAPPPGPRAAAPHDLSIESLMKRFGIRPGKEA